MRYFFILIIVCLGPFALIAQTGTEAVEISELQTPTSPAFTLLGVSPNEISRPKSLNDLEVALTNGFNPNGQFNFPKEFALETNPYWLLRKRPLSAKEWYNAGFGQQILSTLSLSLATAPGSSVLATGQNNQHLAFGIRTQFHPLFKFENKQRQKFIQARFEFSEKSWIMNELPNAIENCLEKYNIDSLPANASMEEKRQKVFEWVQKGVINISPFNTGDYRDQRNLIKQATKRIGSEVGSIKQDLNTNEDLISFGDSIFNRLSRDLKEDVDWRGMVSRMRETYSGENTFLIELGTAYGMYYEDSLVKSGSPGRFGIWITSTYRTPPSSNGVMQGEVIGLLRYLVNFANPVNIQYNRNLDLGLRAVMRIQRFSVSGEVLMRRNWQQEEGGQIILNGIIYYAASLRKTQLDWKASLNLEYRVTNSVSVTYTFGKDFNTGLVSRGGNLMNLLGINVGLFPAMVKK